MPEIEDPFDRFRLRAAYVTLGLIAGSVGWDAAGPPPGLDISVFITLAGLLLALLKLGAVVRIVTGGHK